MNTRHAMNLSAPGGCSPSNPHPDHAPIPSRRQWLEWVGCAGMALTLPTLGRSEEAASPVREIAITAQRFRYTPNEIRAQPGEKIVLLVKSLDFIHGMKLPDYGLRFDLVPGRITRIELPAKEAGVYDFVCDNFCGDAHEEMHGQIVVQA